MKKTIRKPQSSNFKVLLLAGAIILVAALLLYTQTIVERLQEKEREVADLYARSLEFIASGETGDGDFSFIFDEIIKAIDFPIIISDADREPIYPYAHNIKNIRIDTTASPERQRDYLKDQIEKLDQRTPPIRVTYEEDGQSIILNHIHYGDSELIRQLRWLPLVEVALAGLFILIAYTGFSYIKRNEQSNIWVGMAKETAHQIGTPLSSMMGWLELLREQSRDQAHIRETLDELDNDIERLRKIAARFSKIGSRPELHEASVNRTIERVIVYIERRIPQMKKQVSVSFSAPKEYTVKMNAELFEWVIENLIKNALDAIENSKGKIGIEVEEAGRYITIDIHDTGKGIDKRLRKEVFRPGFSTKERGWGLGLSLSRRIVEEYHHGKLYIKESRPGEGTTFRIKLRTG
jgi:signal transduction histidine kinase